MRDTEITTSNHKSTAQRVVGKARTMDVARPILKNASKKNIASPLYYSADETVQFNKIR
jgi:hypothetical protein